MKHPHTTVRRRRRRPKRRPLTWTIAEAANSASRTGPGVPRPPRPGGWCHRVPASRSRRARSQLRRARAGDSRRRPGADQGPGRSCVGSSAFGV